MMKRAFVQGRLSGERGGVLATVAISMFAMILIAAFVVDVANWYQHKRHLQLQADAAALAGADAFSVPLSACSNTAIAASARRYGGSDSPDGSTVRAQLYNDQIGKTSPKNVHILINSTDYWKGTDTSFTDGNPCDADKLYVDVKATETHLPWFFGHFFVPKINAHARVSLLAETSTAGALPIAVPNPLPKSAAAIFIDEANGNAVVRAEPLTEVGLSGSLDMWSTAQFSMSLSTRATGVVIALSGKAAMSLTGNLTAICDQALTDCFDQTTDPPSNGVSFIRGWSSSGRAPLDPPALGDVELFQGGCPTGAYFSTNTSTCTLDIEAKVDSAGLSAPPIITANGTTLTADTGTECSALVGPGTCWHGSISLGAGATVPVTMRWEEQSGTVNGKGTCTNKNNNPCKGQFEGGNTIQRGYSATTIKSGPIKLAYLFDCDAGCGPLHDLQSFQTGTPHSVIFTVGIAGALRNASSTGDPLVSLRVKTNTGQSLDCDPNYQNLKQELAFGCRPGYKVNDGTDPAWNCANLGTSALWAKDQPWKCVAVSTGRQPNDVSAGLNLRILGDEKANRCPPNVGDLGHNNWSQFDLNKDNDGFPTGDPRILDAFLTTYGAFSHVNGTSSSVPVIDFATFYVTGWTGQGGGFDNPCQKAGGGDDPVPGNDSGLIVGHFIKYKNSINTGGGTVVCDPNSFGACVPVMTK